MSIDEKMNLPEPLTFNSQCNGAMQTGEVKAVLSSTTKQVTDNLKDRKDSAHVRRLYPGHIENEETLFLKVIGKNMHGGILDDARFKKQLEDMGIEQLLSAACILEKDMQEFIDNIHDLSTKEYIRAIEHFELIFVGLARVSLIRNDKFLAQKTAFVAGMLTRLKQKVLSLINVRR
jgi:hypothetical protein